MEIEKINENWKLQKIEIEFKYGWSHETDPEKQKDRYEGKITFMNNDSESFSFKVKPNMAQKYIDLISNDIVIAATGLGERLKESLGLKK